MAIVKPIEPNSFWCHHSRQGLGVYIPKTSNDRGLHNFAFLENAFGYSPMVTKKLLGRQNIQLNSYPGPGVEKLKIKIANWLRVDPEMVLLGNGSDELVNLIPQVFLEPGEKAVVPVPTFFRILESIQRMKGNLVTTTLGGLEEMVATTNPKIVWLCSPNNPTGEVVARCRIKKLAGETGALVVVDEAYQEIFDPENRKSVIRLLPKHPNILVLKSFSKAFGLAGIRVGFVVGNREMMRTLSKWQLNFPISTLSTEIAQTALEDTNFLEQMSRNFKVEREFLFDQIARLKNLQIGGRSQTNVFILRHRNKKLFDLLLKEGIVTADFNQMNGLENQNFVRITIRQRQENELLIEALKKINANF